MRSFEEDLAYSENQADAPWWGEVYRQAFPDMVSMQKVPGPNRAQQNGVDRLILLGRDKVLRVDEKTRRKHYDDVLLEIFSNEATRSPGWALKPLTADFVAYAFEPTCRCYLFPVLQLQRALQLNKSHWWSMAEKKVDGFGLHRGSTLARNGNLLYRTLNLAVPTDILLDAIRGAMLVTWGATN